MFWAFTFQQSKKCIVWSELHPIINIRYRHLNSLRKKSLSTLEVSSVHRRFSVWAREKKYGGFIRTALTNQHNLSRKAKPRGAYTLYIPTAYIFLSKYPTQKNWIGRKIKNHKIFLGCGQRLPFNCIRNRPKCQFGT